MNNRAYGPGVMPGGLWRRLVGVVLIHAVAVQALLVVLGAFPLAASANQSFPALELCSHDASGAPDLPANKPDLSGCTHCIFCFAGAQHAVIGGTPAVVHRITVAAVIARWLGDTPGPNRLTRYTIASPRGPPLNV
jgi:hypothetical protein